MSTLTAPAADADDTSLRPVPWRRMAWVTWRQHRFPLGGVAALLGGLALYLWLDGLQVHHAYATVVACHPASSYACQNQVINFNTAYGATANTIATLLQVVPALIGAFVGAPVLARELETGTFRYAWTLSVGRRRWTLAKLVPLAVAVTAAAGAFSLLFSWYYQPFFADGNSIPLDPRLFGLRGIAFAAWTLASFAIGALAGLLIRPGRPRDRRHPGRLRRAPPRGQAVPATALHDTAARQEPARPACFGMDHQRVVDQRRRHDQPVHDEPDHGHQVPADHARDTAQEPQ